MDAETLVEFGSVVPILRIFDIPKALEFYRDYLGCSVDWEHRFAPAMPVYIQVSRGNLILHLSEHHGDGSPGIRVRIATTHIAALHAELQRKDYHYLRPGLEEEPWGETTLTLLDPFGNRLTFHEAVQK
jgi:catechol 2,3-dioxygenase-like lactoylglutathione lyase family enzyme